MVRPFRNLFIGELTSEISVSAVQTELRRPLIGDSLLIADPVAAAAEYEAEFVSTDGIVSILIWSLKVSSVCGCNFLVSSYLVLGSPNLPLSSVRSRYRLFPCMNRLTIDYSFESLVLNKKVFIMELSFSLMISLCYMMAMSTRFLVRSSGSSANLANHASSCSLSVLWKLKD